MKTVLLSTAYLPNVHYLSQVINWDTIVIEKQENFVKQTYRNRCDIVTANGKLSLSIPLIKQADKELIFDKKISYAEDWQKQHWRSITSAYKNSPYFDFLEDELRSFYDHEYQFLHEYNAEQLKWIMRAFRLKKDISYSEAYIEDATFTDLREEIHPKKAIQDKRVDELLHQPYYQTFSDKMGFVPNLSVLDLIFNEGIKGHQYLIL